MEYAIKAEEIVLDIYEETVEDALKRIEEFLYKKGFTNLDNYYNSGLLPYKSDKVLAIEYCDTDKLGFYIFVFKEVLLPGKANIYFVRPSSNIHMIIISMDQTGNSMANLKKWAKLAFLLKNRKGFLKTMLSLKTKEEIANYINTGHLKRPENI